MKISDSKMKCRELKNYLVSWIRDWFERNGRHSPAVIGISGGKDSTIVAALCVEALGVDRVLGVLIPCNEQKDISDSRKVCSLLGIRNFELNVGPMYDYLTKQLSNIDDEIPTQASTNINPRLRMTTLYAVSQCFNGRVVNTSNLSEYSVGYFTRGGDEIGDLKPIINLTCSQVVAIGDVYVEDGVLTEDLVHKTPDDGLPNSSSDEEKLGFSYNELDNVILNGIKGPNYDIINSRRLSTEFKRAKVEAFVP